MIFQIVLVVAASCAVSATVSLGGGSYSGGAPVGYQGPLAKPIVQADGHIADTAEVAAAKGAHLFAVAKEASVSAGAGGDGGHDGGIGGGLGGSDGGDGAFSYGPGTGDVYRGQNGYAGLSSAAGHGVGAGLSLAAGHGGAQSGVNSYGPGTADVYRGQNGYAGLSSAASGQTAHKH